MIGCIKKKVAEKVEEIKDEKSHGWDLLRAQNQNGLMCLCNDF